MQTYLVLTTNWGNLYQAYQAIPRPQRTFFSLHAKGHNMRFGVGCMQQTSDSTHSNATVTYLDKLLMSQQYRQ